MKARRAQRSAARGARTLSSAMRRFTASRSAASLALSACIWRTRAWRSSSVRPMGGFLGSSEGRAICDQTPNCLGPECLAWAGDERRIAGALTSSCMMRCSYSGAPWRCSWGGGRCTTPRNMARKSGAGIKAAMFRRCCVCVCGGFCAGDARKRFGALKLIVFMLGLSHYPCHLLFAQRRYDGRVVR